MDDCDTDEYYKQLFLFISEIINNPNTAALRTKDNTTAIADSLQRHCGTKLDNELKNNAGKFKYDEKTAGKSVNDIGGIYQIIEVANSYSEIQYKLWVRRTITHTGTVIKYGYFLNDTIAGNNKNNETFTPLSFQSMIKF
jgi:hypothetical protein